jgi:amidophosphoribosyltransferase
LIGKHVLEGLEKGVAGPAEPVMVNGYGAEDALQRP